MNSPEALKTTIRLVCVLLVPSGYCDWLKAQVPRSVISGMMNCLRFSGIALTLYDYLLVLGDEVRYVWKGRKTPVFYFYMLTRTALIASRLWEIYVLFRSRNSRAGCIAGNRAQTVIFSFFLFSSDIFITLRVYALTLRNKFIGLYFGALAVTKYTVALSTTLTSPNGYIELPKIPIPLNTFDACVVIAQIPPSLRPVPTAIGTVLDLSAFLVVAWCTFRNTSVLKLSAVIRTIATEATIYFLAMVALQIYVQLSFVFMDIIPQQFSMVASLIISPVLSLRFAVSLKKAANPDGGQEWRLEHFSTARFESNPSAGTHVSTVRDSIEMDSVDPPSDRDKAYGP